MSTLAQFDDPANTGSTEYPIINFPQPTKRVVANPATFRLGRGARMALASEARSNN